MSHVVESAASRKHRRNRRTAIILVVLVVVLAGAFYYAASYFNRPASPSASDCPTGDFTAGGSGGQGGVTAGQVTINVYNATNRAGLAAATAKDVKARGFVVGQVANDPLKKSLAGAGELRYGPNGQAGAALISPMIPGVNFILDTRADATVDFAIGNTFNTLGAAGTATTAAGNPC